jgi:hypothetical protein
MQKYVGFHFYNIDVHVAVKSIDALIMDGNSGLSQKRLAAPSDKQVLQMQKYRFPFGLLGDMIHWLDNRNITNWA